MLDRKMHTGYMIVEGEKDAYWIDNCKRIKGYILDGGLKVKRGMHAGQRDACWIED